MVKGKFIVSIKDAQLPNLESQPPSDSLLRIMYGDVTQKCKVKSQTDGKKKWNATFVFHEGDSDVITISLADKGWFMGGEVGEAKLD